MLVGFHNADVSASLFGLAYFFATASTGANGNEAKCKAKAHDEIRSDVAFASFFFCRFLSESYGDWAEPNKRAENGVIESLHFSVPIHWEPSLLFYSMFAHDNYASSRVLIFAMTAEAPLSSETSSFEPVCKSFTWQTPCSNS